MNKEIGWQKCLVFLLLSGFVPTLFSEEFDKSDWKDPRTRDEDISRTNISVEVSQLEGLYEYVYTISSSAENKGTINSFDVDVSCELDFGDVVMPPGDDTPFARESHSRDGKHVPVSVYGTENAGAGNVGAGNFVGWGMLLKPGEQATVRMLSPTPPRERQYRLLPDMESIGWRYDLYPDEPWIPDFVIQGTVMGPGCVSLDEPEVAFLGRAEEPFGINRLLAYAEPTTDVLTVSSDSAVVTFIIFYDRNIDPGTFKAKVDGKDCSSLFHPAPDSFEEISVPGEWKRNSKIHLSVLGVVEDKSRGSDTFKSIDNDFFDVEIQTQGGPK